MSGVKKYGIAVVANNDNENVNILQTIDAIKNAGFKSVFIQWYDKDWQISQQKQLQYIKEKGLKVIFAHLGYQNINDLWLEGENGDRLVERYIDDIKQCKANSIDMVVMHLTSKSVAPSYGPIGLNRIKRIVEFAKKNDVKVAFENTKIPGYLDYIMDNINDDNVGICLDSGHYHAHFNDQLDWPKFKDRILAIHLHDNDQSCDQHLMPFEGTLDWPKFVKKLKEANYHGPITLELCYRNEYIKQSIDDFYNLGYFTARKIEKMMESD